MAEATGIRDGMKPVEILLIEDNPVDVRMTREAFEEYRIANHFHAVSDGQSGMDFLYRRGKYKDAPRPDLIILDLNLPKKHGSEILNEVKADPKLCSIPIVILTTSSLDSEITRSYCHSASAFITKPIEFDDFGAMMKSIGDFWLAFVKYSKRYA